MPYLRLEIPRIRRQERFLPWLRENRPVNVHGPAPVLDRVGSRDDDTGRDRPAIVGLCDRFGGLVYSVILAIVHEASVAEDLFLETFLTVRNRALEFEGDTNPGRRLSNIARRCAMDYLRSAGRSVAQKTSTSADQTSLIRDAFPELSAEQVDVIAMAWYQGLSLAEITERMGQPLGTVKRWARSALKHVREHAGEIRK
jgi:RNA polymerase sigma-70 factor (ECF subfamily)